MDESTTIKNIANLSILGAGDSSHTYTVKVEGYAEILVEPDIVEFVVKGESVKEKAEDAKNSVTKRIDHLLQIVRNAKIKSDRNVNVHHVLTKVDDQFRFVGEVLVRCDSIQKYEEVVNVIVEKFEGNVFVSEPHFSHSPKCLQEARQRVLRMAMGNARTKATDIASASYQRAGRALLVEERESATDKVSLPPSTFSDALSLRTRVHSQVMHSRVWVVYELKFNRNHNHNGVSAFVKSEA